MTVHQTLLYTGDFKLGPSATSEPAELPHADVLVMESTFGRPQVSVAGPGDGDRPAVGARAWGTG